MKNNIKLECERPAMHRAARVQVLAARAGSEREVWRHNLAEAIWNVQRDIASRTAWPTFVLEDELVAARAALAQLSPNDAMVIYSTAWRRVRQLEQHLCMRELSPVEELERLLQVAQAELASLS